MLFKDAFQYYCQKVLPLVYDESLSYYEVLCKLGEYIRQLSAEVVALQDETAKYSDLTSTLWPTFKAQVEADLARYEEENTKFEAGVENQLASAKAALEKSQADYQKEVDNTLAEFNATIEAIKRGEYIDLYLDSIKVYIDSNLQNMVANLVKFVTFGLTSDGRFAAYIPNSWRFLTFSTITDPDSDLYGHLALSY